MLSSPLASQQPLAQLAALPYPVYFVNQATKWQNLIQSQTLPDRLEPLYEQCIEGVDVWSVQTYLHLKQRGLNVYLAAHPVPNQICVVAYHHLSLRDLPFNSYIVACRLDSARPEICEQQTVMNKLCLEQPTDHFIPHWPQPILLPRDPERGTSVETLSFKGGPLNLAEPFRSPAFQQQLQEMGLKFTQSTGGWLNQYRDWGDYREVDVVLAVRNLTLTDFAVKPPIKLINAWQAGCPAILGPEPAYQDLRQSELDYIEVNSPETALAALQQLQTQPKLYTAMVENGLRRAKEFSTDQTALRWRNLLAGPITVGYEGWRQQSPVQKLVGRPLQFAYRAIRHKQAVKQYIYNRDHGPRPFDKTALR
jgi:hypothetical protein